MNWLKKFMYGRYGVDQLSNGLILVSILLLILNLFLKLPALRYLTTLLIFISYYRMFSKNINKRYQENMKFLNWWNPIKAKLTECICLSPRPINSLNVQAVIGIESLG